MGKPVVMGRKTWDSIGAKPLPGRENFVISRDAQFRAKDASSFSSIEAAIAAGRACAAAARRQEVCVIGGAMLYDALMDQVDRLYLTEVDANPDGDAFFPQFDLNAFMETERRFSPAGPKDEYACVFLTLDRKSMHAR